MARESLHLTDAIRGDLEALDLSTHLLSGPEVLDLLWRRFNPTAADRTPERRPGAREQRLEVVGELDAVADAREAARAAHALRELVAGSAIDCADQRHLRVDRDLEQALYVATLPDATEFGWLLDAMQVQRPFTLVGARARARPAARARAASRRATGGCSASTAAPSCAAARPTTRCSPRRRSSASCSRSSPGTSARRRSRSSIYQSIRERGPDPDPVQLAEAVEQASPRDHRRLRRAREPRASCASSSCGSPRCRSAATSRG